MSQTDNCESNQIMDELNQIIDEFNQRVIAAHHAHYIDGKNELIDTSANASPNGNLIYHLYSDGEITHQKGAWAYLQRSEFCCEYSISVTRRLPFKFVNEVDNGTTYAILTYEECKLFREELVDILRRFKFIYCV